jgi:ethanolamine ammonia-lyase small subunit
MTNDPDDLPAVQDPWEALRAATPARIGIGRVGASQPTRAALEFSAAHAQARDAVRAVLDVGALQASLLACGFDARVVSSAAASHEEYLRRPDRGRRLCDADRVALAARASAGGLVVVLADGLSALAVQRHALPLLEALGCEPAAPRPSAVVIALHARVALGDEIAELLGAGQVVVLVGERPGLSAPDSLGIYMTHAPRVGCTDADRNCISNVRPGGLRYGEAARRLALLLAGARRLGRSGVALKDESGPDPQAAAVASAPEPAPQLAPTPPPQPPPGRWKLL